MFVLIKIDIISRICAATSQLERSFLATMRKHLHLPLLWIIFTFFPSFLSIFNRIYYPHSLRVAVTIHCSVHKSRWRFEKLLYQHMRIIEIVIHFDSKTGIQLVLIIQILVNLLLYFSKYLFIRLIIILLLLISLSFFLDLRLLIQSSFKIVFGVVEDFLIHLTLSLF